MDEERRRKNVRGPLHGIPFLIKDNIATADKMHTSAGSLSLQDMFSPYDAPVVEQLREAGAVLLGKANMSEFAYFMSETMQNGYSSRGGQVISPYVPEADTSGSSTGSAVAVTANLCAFALGTETDGSIISPSRSQYALNSSVRYPCHIEYIILAPRKPLKTHTSSIF
jgi:amidase